jgi:hypothetical protein
LLGQSWNIAKEKPRIELRKHRSHPFDEGGVYWRPMPDMWSEYQPEEMVGYERAMIEGDLSF